MRPGSCARATGMSIVIAGPARQAPRIVAFFDELKGLGFVEGHNLQIVAGGFGLREDQSTEVAATVAKSTPEDLDDQTHQLPIDQCKTRAVCDQTTLVRHFGPFINRGQTQGSGPVCLHRMSLVVMLWTAPPPARECQRCGRC